MHVAGLELVGATSYAHHDHTWQATADDDATVLPRPNETAALDGATVAMTLPPISWNVIRLARR